MLVFILFLCWGSFLNVIAYRLTFDKPFFTKRSYCPSCNTLIAWYDNIPLVSWVLLRGRCRSCCASITILYPFIELLSGVVFTILFYMYPIGNFAFLGSNASLGSSALFISYFIFFSALIVGVRTDLEAMVIPQLVSIWLVPVGVLCSFLGYTRITVLESILGAVIGYGALWAIAASFKYFTKKDGLGVGDMELLALIGSFLGPLGVWFSILVGSVSGLVVGGGYLLVTKQGRNTRIPFGPFLILGATLYFFFESTITQLFFRV